MKNGGMTNMTFDVAGLYEIYFNFKRVDEIRKPLAIMRRSISYLSKKVVLLNFVKNRVESR
jgi:hypothetical protein